MVLDKIIKNNIYYFILTYFLVVLGIFFAIILRYHLNVSLKICFFIYIFLLLIFNLFIPLVLVDLIKNKWSGAKEKINSLKIPEKIAVIVNSIITGMFMIFLNTFKMDMRVALFFLVFAIMLTLISNYSIRPLSEERITSKTIILIFILPVVFSVFAVVIAKIAPNCINWISSQFTDYFTITLAIVLLCATLSLLAFTYCMVLDKSNKKDVMKTNGEKFFISTILSILMFILVLIASKAYYFVIKFNILNLNCLDWAIFIIFGLLVVIILTLIVYTSYYIILGCFSALKLLDFKF